VPQSTAALQIGMPVKVYVDAYPGSFHEVVNIATSAVLVARHAEERG
jgi:hypothetical protein